MVHLTESDIESAAIDWLSGLGYQTLFGPDIATDMPATERVRAAQAGMKDAKRFLNCMCES